MILQETYFDDLSDCINLTPDTVFWMGLLSRDKLTRNQKLMDKLWTEYQKNIEMGVDENYAYAYALEEVLNIPLHRWEDLFQKHIVSRHNEKYGW